MNIERWTELGLLGGGSLILAVAFSKTYEAFGAVWISIGAVGALSVLVLYSRSLAYGIRSTYEARLKAIERAVQSNAFGGKPEWLFSEYDINQIEEEADTKDIWVVSPDLENDTNDADVIPIVKQNARNGIRYTYVVPDNELIEGRIRELLGVFAGIRCKPYIVKVPEKDFFLMTITHITIYNPKGRNGSPGRVFLELPVNGRGWWVEMCRLDGSPYIGRISKLIDAEFASNSANN